MSISIQDLISRINNGDIRIPAFQRNYVWDSDQVAFLLDSIYKKYPIGTVVLWKTEERLVSEKDLGSFTLPDPQKNYPVNYILDGQQRITSIFSTFQTELAPKDSDWVDIYFDTDFTPETHENAFLPLDQSEVDPGRHFPLRTLFSPVEYLEAVGKFQEDKVRVKRIAEMSQVFQQYRIPSEVFETEDRSQVAIVFERINRAGTQLDLFELLSAWSWSEDFDLVKSFEVLQEEISQHGFSGLINYKDIQLKICSAVISGKTTPKDIIELKGEEIRNSFPVIQNGIIGAIDFLKREIGVPSFEMLPYPSMIIPLAVYFATDKGNGVNPNDMQRSKICSWFWNTSLGLRYKSDANEKHAQDIAFMLSLKKDPESSGALWATSCKVDFERSSFGVSNGPSRSFVLMLNNMKPKSFLGGQALDLEKALKKGAGSEFHHIFPKAYLGGLGVDKKRINVIANICFLSRSDNVTIRDRSPTDYVPLMGNKEKEYLGLALCPENLSALSYDTFIECRAKILNDKAADLMAV